MPSWENGSSGTVTAMGLFQGIDLDELVLTGERLTLRPWQRGDADAVHTAFQDRRMHEFLPVPDPYTRRDAIEFVTSLGDEGRAAGTGLGCALVETATGRVVGSAALRLPAPRRVSAEIGYAVHPCGQGNGYAAEASRVLASWAFAHGIARVELHCAVDNIASAKSALRAGFGFEAILRDGVLTPSGPRDCAVFARLPGDASTPIGPVLPPLPAGGLHDGVISLRVTESGDTAAMLDELNSAESLRWHFSGEPFAEAAVTAMAHRARLQWLVGPMGRLTIVAEATGEPAGSIALRQVGPPRVAGIGYGVRPGFRGRGFTSRALRLLTGWAFEQAGFARLELGAKHRNLASQKAALAGGFLPDGTRTARLADNDATFSDEVCFARVNPVISRSAG